MPSSRSCGLLLVGNLQPVFTKGIVLVVYVSCEHHMFLILMWDPYYRSQEC